jgi:hypothetical protein
LIGIVADFVTSTYLNVINVRREYQKEQNTSEQQAEKAAQRISEECSFSLYAIEVLRPCLMEKLSAYVKQDNQSKDAQAQLDMAQWAFATFVVGSAGLVISIFGLVVVWSSLRQTREAINNDREIGQAQVRAYIAVDIPTIIGPIGTPYEFRIRNTGASPAKKVRYFAGQLVLDHPLPESPFHIIDIEETDTRIPKQVIPTGQFIVGEAKLKHLPTVSDLESIKSNGDRRMYLVIRVFYEDVFTKPQELSFCAFSEVSLEKTIAGQRVTEIEWVMADVLNDAT